MLEPRYACRLWCFERRDDDDVTNLDFFLETDCYFYSCSSIDLMNWGSNLEPNESSKCLWIVVIDKLTIEIEL